MGGSTEERRVAMGLFDRAALLLVSRLQLVLDSRTGEHKFSQLARHFVRLRSHQYPKYLQDNAYCMFTLLDGSANQKWSASPHTEETRL